MLVATPLCYSALYTLGIVTYDQRDALIALGSHRNQINSDILWSRVLTFILSHSMP